jgi:hypothetical protein
MQFNPDVSSLSPWEMEVGDHKYGAVDHYVGFFTAESPGGVGGRLTTLDNVITIIYVGGESTQSSFYLPNLLSTYGRPGGVYVDTTDTSPDNVLPFTLLLYYPDLKFAMNYDILAVRAGDDVVGCPQWVSADLWSWSFPEGSEDYVDASRVQDWVIGVGNRNRFMMLEDATDLDLESFFETYSDPQNSTCIRTPASLWD